jgi:hypothetical protein
MSRDKRTFKIHRGQIALNVVVQVILAGAILVMANFYAFNHYKRWDFSRNEKYALSSQTRQLLKGLKKPLKIVIVFSPDVIIYKDVAGLLKEFQYASRNKIEIETVDQYRNFTRAKELQAQYKFGSDENLLILDYKGRTKFVSAMEMADIDTFSPSPGEPPRVKAFKGEQALSSALIGLTEEKQGKVCIVTGHGEPDLKSNELSTLRTCLEHQNLKAESLPLVGAQPVPEDASALMIIGPTYDFSDREMAVLKSLWEKKGRLFIALNPNAHLPKLQAFLEKCGVTPQDDRVMATISLGPNIAVTGVVHDVNANFVTDSKVVKRLKGVNTMFLGSTQSLKLDTEKSGLRIESLVKAADGFWGETDYNVNIKAGGRVDFDTRKDHGPPLTLAASVESGGVHDPRVDVGGGRMVVVGNADFLNSDALMQVEPNVDLLLSSLNWLLDRENLSGVAPKPVHEFSLNLTEAQISRLSFICIIIIPVSVGIIGIIAHLRRRR